MNPDGSGGVSRGAFIAVAVVAGIAVVGVAVLGVLFALRSSKPDEPGAGSATVEATISVPPTQTAALDTTTVPDASTAATVVSQAKPKPAGVAVTKETGESYCLVKKTVHSSGKDYVVVDYIQLGTVDHGSEDYDIINQNPKLRTFRLANDSWLGAYWLCVDLYGQSVTEQWDFGGGGVGRGYKLKRADFKRIVKQGKANDHSYWFIKVKSGRVVSLVQTYQD